MTCEYVVERAAAALPSNAYQTLFQVSGGRVVVTAVFGELTDGVTGAASAQFDASGVSLGNNVPFGGAAAGNLFGGSAVGLAASIDVAIGSRVVQDGKVIRVHVDAAISTGEARYTLVYRPLDPGAKVEAV